MRSPRPIRQPTSTATAVGAPVGGLNSRDSLAAMPPTDASVMVNLMPYADRVATRAGYTLLSTASSISATGREEGFRQLMSYSGTSTSDTALGAFYWEQDVAGTIYQRLRIYSIATNGTLTTSYEVSASGSTDDVTGMGEWTQFGSASGTSYLLFPVGYRTAAPTSTFRLIAFDGVSWTTPSVTGVPYLTLGIHAHQNRVWFYNTLLAADALTAYYLPIGAIAGTVQSFSLAPLATRGGKIVAMRTWTIDGATGGTDDMAVFVTNRGQAIVFEGTDPSSASTWRLVGVFDIGPVASFTSDTASSALRHTLKDSQAMKYGADMLLLLNSGLTSANRVLRPQEAEGADYSLSSKIRSTLTDAATAWLTSTTAGGGLGAWKMCFLPWLKQLVVNIPTGRVTTTTSPALRYQMQGDWYVMNTETGAWTKFDSLYTWDMVRIGNALYFTDGGLTINKYDGTATSDNSANIVFECRQAYNYLDSPYNKLLSLMQPQIRATGNFSIGAQVDVDFNARTMTSANYTAYTVAAEGNVMIWSSPSQIGRAAAVHLKGQTTAGIVSWYATNWVSQPAGVL